MSNISTSKGSDPTLRIVPPHSNNNNNNSSNNSGSSNKRITPNSALEDPISSYVGTHRNTPQSAIHFLRGAKSPTTTSSKALSTTKCFILFFSVLLILSVVFVYIHTSSIEQQGIRIFHAPLLNHHAQLQQQELNPLVMEELKLQSEREKYLLQQFQHQQQQQGQQQGQQQALDNQGKQQEGQQQQQEKQEQLQKAPQLKTIDDYKANIDNDQDSVNKQRRVSVVEAMKHAYHNYEKYAMGHDELKPLSHGFKDWVQGGMAMTLVDSLDTLYIMGLKDEFARAVKYTKKSMPTFNKIHSTVSVFETVIRMVGGFLSAYDLSGERVFLDKAREMGDIMAKAFDPSTNMFGKSVNLRTGAADRSGSVVLAEVGTLQLEFRRLSQVTGDPKYDDMVTKLMNELRSHGPADGLYPVSYSPHGRRFHGVVTMGGLGDSFFEYLLKQWLMTGKTENMYLEMYQKSLHGIMTKMVDNFDKRNPPVSFIADYSGYKIPRVQHLACFAAGMLALGEANDASKNPPPGYQVDSKEVMKVAGQFATACVESYRMTKTGIGPEGFEYTGDGQIRGHGYYILRPETVESLFVLYRVTGDKKYQDMAWELFSNMEKSCKVAGGYSGLHDVNQPGSYNDVQESFFLAETLKYLYLIFSPTEVIPLDQWVFNTEAHPLKITQKK